jgi:uncharacterized protein
MGSELRFLKSIKSEKYSMELLVTANQNEIYLVFERIDHGAIIDLGVFHAMLEGNGIVYGVDLRMMKSLVKQFNGGKIKCDEEKFLLAHGKSPNYGKDGYIDFHVSPSVKDPKYDIDDEMIDYKNTSLISNVTTDQHLATIVEASPCECGINVYGITIEVNDAQPFKVRIGQGVYQEDNRFFSSFNGMFINENEVLSVTPVYIVNDSVDFTIGNINFVGKVIVQKDVLDDFSISGEEGVEVKGIVGAANIDSGSNLSLEGGINGQGKTFIKCKGELNAKYLNEVNATAWEGINISKSIINSNTKTKGKVEIIAGSIIGGETCALKGIDVSTLGSDLGIMTRVISGQDYENEDRKKSYEMQLENIRIELARIDRVIGPIISNNMNLMKLPAQNKKLVISMIEKAKNCKKQEKEIYSNIEALGNELTNVGATEIIVRKVLYSGVKITIGQFSKIIKMDIKGPIAIKEDFENNTLMIVESIK